ncbi:bifunctional metallophosphatase/5'-nucleotidase [Idiomarina aquatica]|uniref:Bifunctional metallophosphatase/5'-nucleotidase n=1 Tax=Idiomarina aquatica TaxID=1327752 RepID=A0AA94JDB9_9GAMM|nr:5'-nucleotidase C-terminal domain-containing protein [Idiomarina aquatica]RUO43175.1 bifunctional metallophosphatase/5'-nucleotidase [Idiomarina aquatica]
MALGRLSALAASFLLIAGCASQAPQAPENMRLTVLHVNDHHSNLAPKQRQLSWGGQQWQVESGGFPRVAAQIDQLRAQNEQVLTLHAGDAITGSLFFTLFGSEPDAVMMNQVCFDAFTLGNHEFDKGDEGLKTFLDQLGTPACDTAKLSANVKPELGVSALTPSSMTDSFRPYTVFERGGHRIGVVGLTIATKTKKSSQPDETTQFEDELVAARRAISQLQAQGVEKIILLSHIQYQRDLALIPQLPAVDVVIGGDSHTLLGDFSEFGMQGEGAYPTVLTNADGETVCLAHAYQYSQVVGELQVDFRGDQVASCGGRPHFLLGNEITPVEGAVTTLKPIKTALQNSGVFSFVEPDPGVQRLLDNYQHQVDEFSGEVLAQVPETICNQEIDLPRRPGCSDVLSSAAHRLTAQAFLHAVPDADFALQNGGSIRGDIEAGEFTRGDAFSLLPFANTLVKIEISGSELKQVMEEGLAYAVSDGGSTRAYPYGAGIRYDVNLTENFGDRVANLQVWDKDSASWQPVRPRDTYIVVTNSFIGGGQDGYETFHSLSERGRTTNTGIDYAEAMANYAKAQGVLTRPSDYATQSYVPLPKKVNN